MFEPVFHHRRESGRLLRNSGCPLAKQRAEKYLKQLQFVGAPHSIAAISIRGHEAPPHDRRALMHRAAVWILDEPTAGWISKFAARLWVLGI